MAMTSDISLAAAAIRSADALLITAGAGMGVDSGLPDFRGNEGFWKAYPVVARLGLSFEDMANPAWFKHDPHLAWAFYGHRLNLYRRTVPHDGFATLLQWALGKPEGYFVFTSNVDGHFQKAGFAPERVVECHGSIHHFQCARPCRRAIWEAADEQVSVNENDFRARHPLPRCGHCGGMARPNILMFGDFTWIADRSGGQYGRFNQWLAQLKSARLAVIELGAGAAIPTVRHLSEDVAGRLQGTLIRINPREATVPEYIRERCFSVEAGAMEGIKKLVISSRVANQ
jgi:NAD-dependent SIR2 family protein deacetylase